MKPAEPSSVRTLQLEVAESGDESFVDQDFDLEAWLANLLVDFWLSTRQGNAEMGDNNAV